jgi:hypothetical protein
MAWTSCCRAGSTLAAAGVEVVAGAAFVIGAGSAITGIETRTAQHPMSSLSRLAAIFMA